LLRLVSVFTNSLHVQSFLFHFSFHKILRLVVISLAYYSAKVLFSLSLSLIVLVFINRISLVQMLRAW